MKRVALLGLGFAFVLHYNNNNMLPQQHHTGGSFVWLPSLCRCKVRTMYDTQNRKVRAS